MEEIKAFLLDKKNLATLTLLTFMLVILPLGIALIRQQQIFKSKASGERIQLGTGRCVTEKDGKKVLTCTEVPLNLSAPFDPAATAQLPTENNGPRMSKLTQLASKIIPEAKATSAYGLCAGDTSPGTGGYYNVEVNGCGEVLNYSNIYHSCTAESDLVFKSPTWNATKKEWETVKSDKTISQDDMIRKAAADPRMGGAKFLSSTDNPPWINCNLFIEYSGRTDCDTVTPKGTNDSNKLQPGESVTIHVKRGTDHTQPDCREQIKTQLVVATPTPAPTVAATPTPAPTAAASPTPAPTAVQCTQGTFGSAQMELATGCGTVVPQIQPGATSGVITYVAPATTSDLVCNLKVTTANTGDCKLTGDGKGITQNPLKPGESMNVTFTNVCTDNVTGCNLPIIISNSGPVSTAKGSYKLAETETALSTAQEVGLTSQQFTSTYTLKDSTPGMKQIWVEFIDKKTGTKTKDFLTVELVDNDPLIKQASCQIDISKSGVNFDINGLRFGLDSAKAFANGVELDVTSWNSTNIKGTLKNATLTAGDQIYKVKITRKDNASSSEVQCRLGIAQISLGTQLLCRGEGKLDLTNVSLTIIDQAGKKAEETATITKDGILTGLKTKFEIGKNYTLSIKAPRILRRNITFKAQEGTTVITKDDGTVLQLPVGDIYPASISGDGTINTLDQAEIMRQWRILEAATANLSGDFNDDKRVNAFDWSCMRVSFGLSNDPLPTAPPVESSDTTFTEGNPGGTITVIFGTPAPNATESATPSCKPRPACLDQIPRCDVPETTDMCPPPSPSPQNEPKVLNPGKVN